MTSRHLAESHRPLGALPGDFDPGDKAWWYNTSYGQIPVIIVGAGHSPLYLSVTIGHQPGHKGGLNAAVAFLTHDAIWDLKKALRDRQRVDRDRATRQRLSEIEIE